MHSRAVNRLRRQLPWALGAALAVAFLPGLVSTGPSAQLDASSLLVGGKIWGSFGVIFLGGLLTAMTPCVYPLIPITVGVFGARQASSRGRAMLLTGAYVVGMGAVFSALGLVAALSGKAFGSVLGNGAFSVFLAVFMAVLAASMFGAFELALPSALATRLSGLGGSGIAGAFLMGSVSGFLAAPCTGPVLTGVLTFVAQTKNAPLGALLLFTYAMGIGVPFFLIGVFTVRLPKGGEWMDWVKSVFGIVLLAMAVGYLRDGIGPFAHAIQSALGHVSSEEWLWLAPLLAALGVLGGAIHESFKHGAGKVVLKGAGVALVVLALVARAESEPKPASSVKWALQFVGARTTDTSAFDGVLASAKSQGKPVMVDFFAEWCAACKELDELTYSDPSVAAGAERFVAVKVDGTDEDDVTQVLYDRYGIKGLPTVVFIDSEGNALGNPRVTGFVAAEPFLKTLEAVP